MQIGSCACPRVKGPLPVPILFTCTAAAARIGRPDLGLNP